MEKTAGTTGRNVAAAYIRVSTEDQLEFSPDSQIKRVKEYAKQHQLELPEELIFLDEGISGRYARKRPGFMRMIGMAKQKPRAFDVILVWKFSRFSRNRQESIFYKSMLRKECGIDVISVSEQLSDDPTSILIEALLEAMDEYYSINLAQEVRRGMHEKFTRGGVVSIPPFGYKMGEQRFEADESRACYVKMIFHDFMQGSSGREIALKLNKMGVRTIRGNVFEKRSVEYILSNPVYIGMQRRKIEVAGNGKNIYKNRQRKEYVVRGEHEPLIDETTFRKVQLKLEEYKRYSQTATRNTKYEKKSALQGLVKCSSCGAFLTLTDHGKSMQCQRYTKGKCRESHHIRLEKLKKLICDTITEGVDEKSRQGLLEGTDGSEKSQDKSELSRGDILTILNTVEMGETEKSEKLKEFISEIIFERKNNQIRICYQEERRNS